MNSLALAVLAVALASLRAAEGINLPTFEELLAAYPGYRHHGGSYSDASVLKQIGADGEAKADGQRSCLPADGDTSALRLSIALNGIGGDHRVGRVPIRISKQYDVDSCPSPNGWHNIFRPTAFGPYLAMKYSSPVRLWPDVYEPAAVLKQLGGHRGIIRVLTWHEREKSAGARLALWDCDHFHQSRDLTSLHHIISVEFWQTSGAACPRP